ncbi:hypothetical protein EU537_10175 [Candidatus Thorarchaeota archaeon]|nr:MAG: hypothetical protein EU537_10175 [Candidatus Thorarchaeota archaeon]
MSDENIRVWNLTAERCPGYSGFDGGYTQSGFKIRVLQTEAESDDSHLIKVPLFYRILSTIKHHLAKFSMLNSD